MKLVTIKEAASLKNRSTSAIHAAIKRGAIVKYDDNQIDIDDSKNVPYFANINSSYLTQNKHASENNVQVQTDIDFNEYLDYCEECKEENEKPDAFNIWRHGKNIDAKVFGTLSEGFDVQELGIEKVRMDIDHKASQKLQKDIANAEKLGAIVDIVMLRKKFGAFYEVILNEFLTTPQSIASPLWNKAKESENPELTIIEVLQERFTEIIQRSKLAAKEIRPEECAIQYKLMRDE